MQKGGWRARVERSIREIVFGAEDSLVSTLGTVTGIAAGTGDAFLVVLSGTVLIFVEALSMSAGSFLSSKTAQEVFERRQKEDRARLLQRKVQEDNLEAFLEAKRFSKKEREIVHTLLEEERKLWIRDLYSGRSVLQPALSTSPLMSGVVMGVFYVLGGFFPLFPYIVLPVSDAMLPSLLLTGAVLFGLGVAKARVTHGSWVKSGFEMMVISLSAAILGYFIGRLFSSLFGVPIM